MSVFQPRDWTRMVGASQCGHWIPLGRIRRKNTVAAMIRRMKKATKMTPNHTASDMVPPVHMDGQRQRNGYRRFSTTAQGSTQA
jgi:hypothetical protein